MSKTFSKIYDIVRRIPRGKVMSYGDVAKLTGTTPRVVGFALHSNPDPDHIPCHRVVFKDGSLTEGFAFGGPEVQRQLLRNESVKFDQQGRAVFLD